MPEELLLKKEIHERVLLSLYLPVYLLKLLFHNGQGSHGEKIRQAKMSGSARWTAV